MVPAGTIESETLVGGASVCCTGSVAAVAVSGAAVGGGVAGAESVVVGPAADGDAEPCATVMGGVVVAFDEPQLARIEPSAPKTTRTTTPQLRLRPPAIRASLYGIVPPSGGCR